MSGEERELLLAAQKQAMEVLSASSAQAKRVASEAEAEALALMLEQQKAAESLLQREHKRASAHDDPVGETSDLLESHRTAAELLAVSESDTATSLSEAKKNAAVDVLMAGHREASAILLDAWMQVAEGRPPVGGRPRKS